MCFSLSGKIALSVLYKEEAVIPVNSELSLAPVASDAAVTAGFSVLNNDEMTVDVLPAAMVVKSGI